MGLSFLNKKSWHPSTVQNVELVWQAEQAEKQRIRDQQERQKKLREDREIEHLKQV